jgi:excisionase family DNA binding protein
MAALLTINDFTNEYNISRSTVYRLRDKGAVPHVHIGRAVRIRREDAERWYKSLCTDVANDDACLESKKHQ